MSLFTRILFFEHPYSPYQMWVKGCLVMLLGLNGISYKIQNALKSWPLQI